METLVREQLIQQARRAPLRFLTQAFIEHRLRQAERHPERYLCIEGLPIPRPGFLEMPDGRVVAPIAGGAPNTSPLFPLTPLRAFVSITAANTATDGTGTVNALITAGGNGSLFSRVLLIPLGTNTASKAYIFWNNGGSQAAAANNALLRDIPLAAATASNTALIGAPVEVAFQIPMASGDVINATLATAVATGVKVIAIAGSY